VGLVNEGAGVILSQVFETVFAIGLIARFHRSLKEGGLRRKERRSVSDQWGSRESAADVPVERHGRGRQTRSRMAAPARRK
jgi:hypothetical protein